MNDGFMYNLIVIVLFVVGMGVWFAYDNSAQEDCVRHHGHVTRIHGGHGGWICEDESHP